MEALGKINMCNYAALIVPNLRGNDSFCYVPISAIRSEQRLWHHCTLYCIKSLLSEDHFQVCLISVKANWSCVCLFNTWLSEMKAERVKGQVCNFPVFQITASWMQAIMLGYWDYTRWNLRNRLADMTICSPICPSRSNVQVQLIVESVGAKTSQLLNNLLLTNMLWSWCSLTKNKDILGCQLRRKRQHKDVLTPHTKCKRFDRIMVWTTPPSHVKNTHIRKHPENSYHM